MLPRRAPGRLLDARRVLDARMNRASGLQVVACKSKPNVIDLTGDKTPIDLTGDSDPVDLTGDSDDEDVVDLTGG